MALRFPVILFAACLALPLPGMASERASGKYIATKACDAYSSFTKANNPGSVRTAPGGEYDILEVNKAPGWEWIRVELPGAEPVQRWVPRECGVAEVRLAAAPMRPGAQPRPDGMCSTYDKHDSYVLAASWQPGFCEHTGAGPGKPECKALDSGELAIAHLTLHGLWPNRQECGTAYGNCKGPDGKPRPFQLNEDTVSRIAPWMPNFYFEQAFGKYEWNKHGACQALDTDGYFDVAIRAVRQLNDAEIGKYIREHIGRSMPVAGFFERVRQVHGADVASNIQLVCSGGSFLQELRVRLPRQFVVDQELGKLVAGPGFSARTDGCGSDVHVEQSGPD